MKSNTRIDFEKSDGKVDLEKIGSIIIDLNDGYLRTLDEVTYTSAVDENSILGLAAGKDTHNEANVQSKLISTLSNFHSITNKHTIKDEDREFIIKRLAKLAPRISKLSDQYSMHDKYYREHYHSEVRDFCHAVQKEAKQYS